MWWENARGFVHTCSDLIFYFCYNSFFWKKKKIIHTRTLLVNQRKKNWINKKVALGFFGHFFLSSFVCITSPATNQPNQTKLESILFSSFIYLFNSSIIIIIIFDQFVSFRFSFLILNAVAIERRKIQPNIWTLSSSSMLENDEDFFSSFSCLETIFSLAFPNTTVIDTYKHSKIYFSIFSFSLSGY